MSEKELKPCPFCGGEAGIPTNLDGTPVDYEITDCCCKNDDCPLADYWTPIKIWQTRPIEDALRKRIAELEMKIRHNALWQASEDAEERAHLEKLVPDLKKRIAELEETVDRLIEAGNALSKVIKRAHWLGGDEAVGRWHNLTGKWKMKKERDE